MLEVISTRLPLFALLVPHALIVSRRPQNTQGWGYFNLIKSAPALAHFNKDDAPD